MPKALKRRDVLRVLRTLGFEQISQRGSHLKFKRTDPSGDVTAIVPNYSEIPAGTVASIARQAKVTWAEFEALL
ncbi:MAG TPA: type II toxin-antitoxin system HicA family toxin [Dehalococcoidia bacterium]